jgi:hypothetical protein
LFTTKYFFIVNKEFACVGLHSFSIYLIWRIKGNIYYIAIIQLYNLRQIELYIFNLDGLRFYRSENNVILCSGDQNGYLKPRYFSRVADLKKSNFIFLNLFEWNIYILMLRKFFILDIDIEDYVKTD